MSDNVLSTEAASFCNQLHALGVEGFTNWLREAYTGPEIIFPRGIHYDEDLDFCEKFFEVAHEFPREMRALAATSVLTVLTELAAREEPPLPFGLYSLSSVAMNVHCREAIPALEQVLGRVNEKLSLTSDDTMLLDATQHSINALKLIRPAAPWIRNDSSGQPAP